MRIAVLGSWRAEDVTNWGLCEEKAFAQACKQVGREVIARGHSLIVGTDSLHTADGLAAQGAFEALANVDSDRPRITVVRLDEPGGTRPFDAARRERAGVFVDHLVDAASMAVVKLVQAQLADALMLIGGAEKTEQAGLIAAFGKRPLACIGSFGGAAAALNKRFLKSPTTWGYESWETKRLDQLQEPFSDLVLRAALEQAWIEGAPKLMIIHGRSTDRDVLKEYLLQHVGRVIVLADEIDTTQPIPIKFERFASSVDGAIALVTPDDVGGLAAAPGIVVPRARENVWLEVGWFWGRRRRANVMLLTKGEVNIPSDLGGVEKYEYTTSPDEAQAAATIQKFIARLRAASEAAEVA